MARLSNRQKAINKYRIQPDLMVRRPLVKHIVWQNDKKLSFDYYDEIPRDEYESEDGPIDCDFDREPYYSEVQDISGKLLIKALSDLIEEYNLKDAYIAWVTNYDGYFEDAYVYGYIPKTEEDIDREIAEGIEKDKEKERKKEAIMIAREAKKKKKELALLAELEKKYKE